MAKGEIHYSHIDLVYNSSTGHYDLTGVIQFKYKSSYVLKDESIRVYYTTTPGSASSADYVDIVPPGTSSSDDHAIEADFWQKPYTPDANPATFLVRVGYRLLGFSPDMYLIRFTIPNLSPYVKWYTRAWLRLFKKATSTSPVKPNIHDPVPAQERYTFGPYYSETRPLFCVANYKTASNDTYEIEWVDFTDCIKLPTYDVNSEDVNEDWEDADYKTHRIIARKKVTGKFEMIFPTIERFNQFLNYIEQSKQLNGDGVAYVDLQVHVNNMLDVRPGIALGNTKCINYIGKFFIKIDNNAWVLPIFGHYDKYSPLSITITET